MMRLMAAQADARDNHGYYSSLNNHVTASQISAEIVSAQVPLLMITRAKVRIQYTSHSLSSIGSRTVNTAQ